MNKKVPRFILILAAVFLTAIGSWTVSLLAKARQKDQIVLQGTMEATQYSLGSPLGGIVARTEVNEGDRVEAQAVIGVLKHDDLLAEREALASSRAALDAQRREGEVKLANATRNLNRLKGLAGAGSVSKQKIDDTDSAVREATAYLDAAKFQVERTTHQIAALDEKIAYATVHAPTQGIVVGRYYEVGEIVPPGGVLAKIADMSEMWLKVYVTADQLGLISIGQQALVRAEGSAQHDFEGKISNIAAEAEFTPKNVQTSEERADLVYAVKITVPNPEGVLKIGMPVDVVLHLKEAKRGG